MIKGKHKKGILTDTFIKRIKPETVAVKTGRSWEEWDKILDELNVKKHGSPAISRYLREEYGVSMWWSNTILTRYKQLNNIS